MKALDKFVRARKAVKADRSTEQGIAGHQAAMKALGSGYDKGYDYRYGDEQIGWPEARHPDSRGIDVRAKTVPGQGHVIEYHTNIAPSGRYRGINTVPGGTKGIKPGKLTEKDDNNGN